MVRITIDGEEYQAENGQMIIEVADANGVQIPRFCYHKKLSIAANCRMCLVEVEKSRKTLPACATPVTDGMVVHTQSKEAVKSQKAVMEFLLINHPLDCPICDQGGECELQDVSMGFGEDVSRYTEGKRSVEDEDLGSLISTDMTRCIHCTRCVRFGEEVAGYRELGMTGRGEASRIGTYLKGSVDSPVSGNVIDLCPVGALTSKPFRYTARAWELTQQEGIAPHDCLGSNIRIHTRRDKVMRVLPRENDSINETWLSDRDRYAYAGVNHAERIGNPRLKSHDQWQGSDWQTALTTAVSKLKSIIDEHGPESVGMLISPSATLEECYLAQAVMRGMGSNNIDHRLHQQDFRDDNEAPLAPVSDLEVQALANCDAALLVGSWLQTEQPIADLALRRAAVTGADIHVLNAVDNPFNYDIKARQITHPANWVRHLCAVLKALDAKEAAKWDALLSQVDVDDFAKEVAESLRSHDNPVVIAGPMASNHADASVLRALVRDIARACGGKLVTMTEGCNAAGAWLAGAVPHRTAAGDALENPGLNAQAMLASPRKAYISVGVEPELDCVDSQQALLALREAEFVLVLSAFKSNAILDYADIILPIAPFSDTSGTYVNVNGTWQSFTASVKPYKNCRPAWKVLRVMGNLLSLEGFDYESSREVRDDVKKACDMADFTGTDYVPADASALNTHQLLTRVGSWPMYRIDAVVRRATPLQRAPSFEAPVVRIHSADAKQHGIEHVAKIAQHDGKTSVTLPVIVDDNVAEGCVYVASGLDETIGLGAAFGPISITASNEHDIA